MQDRRAEASARAYAGAALDDVARFPSSRRARRQPAVAASLPRTVRLALASIIALAVSGLPVFGQCHCGYGDGRFATHTGIVINGAMGDWSPVLADTDNNSCDGGEGIGPTDRDAPVQSTGRNLLHFAYTWDNTHVQAYTGRQASTSNVQTFVYYADTDNDGLMETGERVIAALWQGNNREVDLFYGTYSPAAAGGDPMLDGNGFADGYTLPGTIIGLPPSGQPDATGDWGSSDGLSMEWEVSWSVLGIPAGSAFTFHVSSSNTDPGAANFADKIDDNMAGCGGGAASTQYAELTLAPDVDVYGDRGTTVYAAHIIVNQGNGADVFNLTEAISGDHAPTVSYYLDADGSGTFTPGDALLTDTDGDGAPDTGPVPAWSSVDILAAYAIAGDAAGTATSVLTATSSFDHHRSDTVTDTIALAPVVSVTKSAAPANVAAGAAVTYTITITNAGYGDASVTAIQDTLSTGFGYVPGSTTGLTTADPSVTSQTILEWTGAWIAPKRTGEVDGTLTLSFQATAAGARGTFPNFVTVSGGNFTAVQTGPTAEVTVTAPLLCLAKSVDKAQAKPGEELLYTIHYRNAGDGGAQTLVVMDTVPLHTTYVPGSLRLGAADSTYAAATPKTDDAGDDEGAVNGGMIVFTLAVVAPDDGSEGTGADEGKIYFKVTVD